jgi:hypothetical protein
VKLKNLHCHLDLGSFQSCDIGRDQGPDKRGNAQPPRNCGLTLTLYFTTPHILRLREVLPHGTSSGLMSVSRPTLGLRVAKKRVYCLRWQMQRVVLQLHRCVDLTLSYLIVPIDNSFYHRVQNPESDAKARCELFCVTSVLSVQRRLVLNCSLCQTNISGNWTSLHL